MEKGGCVNFILQICSKCGGGETCEMFEDIINGSPNDVTAAALAAESPVRRIMNASEEYSCETGHRVLRSMN